MTVTEDLISLALDVQVSLDTAVATSVGAAYFHDRISYRVAFSAFYTPKKTQMADGLLAAFCYG